MMGGEEADKCGSRIECRCSKEGGGGFDGGIGGGDVAVVDVSRSDENEFVGEERRSG